MNNNTIMQNDLYNLLTGNEDVDALDFVDNSRIIIVNFDDNCPFSCCNAFKSYTYMMVHVIDMRNLEIVTYRKQTQTISTIIDNNAYRNDMTISQCNGDKCRKIEPDELCLSCNEPDYLSFYELLLLLKDANIFDNQLIIYTKEDYENVFDNMLDVFTETYISSSGSYSGHPDLVNIGEKEKVNLIDTVYSAFTKSWSPLRNYLHELKIGPDPSELPIPTTLLNKN